VILIAALTVALHHLALWMLLPSSVFNYDAPIWVVLVHAAFVVLESIATCYIARSFFDNVIGLEKIVQARTNELDARTRDMRLVLDNVDQGFITIDREGRMSNERSAIRDRSGFLEFFEETREMVNTIDAGTTLELTLLKRLIHTLKGNSAIFGIMTLGDTCHELETLIDEAGERPAPGHFGALLRAFDRVRVTVEALHGQNARETIEVEQPEYDAILCAAMRNEAPAKLARRIASWSLEPTSRRLERVSEQVQRIAARLNKGPVTIELQDNELRLEAPRWASFWSSFVHVVRNAIDHGLESRERRREVGKPERGTLRLTTAIQNGMFVIEIADDGRGIDWSAIAERARAKGIPHTTREELTEAVFTDGISTAAYVTEMSGRGVGMAAVRAECRARRGEMALESTPGAGTKIRFSFSLESMAEDRTARYAA
jgi:two-component system, chemotaxis family, sensor kinase CheA